MTDPEIYYLPVTKAEADSYVYAIERVTQVWLSGKAKNRHLQQKHVHSYNAIRKLLEELRRIVYSDLGSPLDKGGPAFDLELARENEGEARSLDAGPRDTNPSVKID